MLKRKQVGFLIKVVTFVSKISTNNLHPFAKICVCTVFFFVGEKEP